VSITVTVCNFDKCSSRTITIRVTPKQPVEVNWVNPYDSYYGAFIQAEDPQFSDYCLHPGQSYILEVSLYSEAFFLFDEYWILPKQVRDAFVQFYINGAPLGGPVPATEFSDEGTYFHWIQRFNYTGGTTTFRAVFLGSANFSIASTTTITMHEFPFGCGG
jgi:hypothetical protein